MAPKRVQLPDGSIGEFPETMGDDQIEKVLAAQFPAPAQPNLATRIQSSFDTDTAPNPNETVTQGLIRHAVKMAGTPFVHPLEFGKATLQTLADSDADYHQAPIKLPNGQVDLPPLPSNPLVDRAQEFGQDWQDSPAHAIGNLAGDAIGGYALGKVAEGVPAAKELPSLHSATRDLVKELNPDAALKYKTDFPRVAPDVQDILNRSGQPLATAEELGNHMATRADELSQHYKDQIFDPTAKEVVTVPKNLSSNIHTVNEGGTMARLGDIQSRISLLNRELAPDYEGGTITSDAKIAKQNELTGLTDILYQNQSRLTGIPVEQLADLRQRTGILNKLANRTQEADTNILTGAANRGTGNTPRSKFAAGAQLIDSLKGGASKVADKKISKVINNLPPLQAEPLPTPTPVTPAAAAPRWQRPPLPTANLPSINQGTP